jgi:hypothetical protein
VVRPPTYPLNADSSPEAAASLSPPITRSTVPTERAPERRSPILRQCGATPRPARMLPTVSRRDPPAPRPRLRVPVHDPAAVAVESGQRDVAIGRQHVRLMGAHIAEQLGGESAGRDDSLSLTTAARAAVVCARACGKGTAGRSVDGLSVAAKLRHPALPLSR